MPQGILFVFYMTRTAPCSRSESRYQQPGPNSASIAAQ